MSDFQKNELVTHVNKHGVQVDYFTRYCDPDYKRAVVSDGDDCYEVVDVEKLSRYAGSVKS